MVLSMLAMAAGPCGRSAAAQTQPASQELPAFERGSGEPIVPKGADAAGGGAIDTRISSLPPDFEVPGAQVVPEGTYLPRVVGRVIRTARGDVVFAPDKEQPAENTTGLPSPLPLMVLLPNARRDQLGAALSEDPLGVSAEPAAPTNSDPKPYALGGQVYVYHGRSYLLCSTFAGITDKRPASPPGAETPVAPEGVDQLIKDLERTSEERRVLTPGAGSIRRREKSDDTVSVATTDGSVLTNRRGRLVRLTEEGGRLAFVVDNDPDSPAMPSLVLLPCQVLEEVEGVAAARGPELVVRMSGRIVSSGGKASLLPIFFQVERRGDITPGQ